MQDSPATKHARPAQAVPKRMTSDIRPAPRPAAAVKSRKRSAQVREFLKRRAAVLALVACVVIIGTLTYGYISTKHQLTNLSHPQPTNTEVGQLTASIGKHLELPTETPTIATVEDVSKLNTQAFFKSAQNGDKVLIYPKTGRALLYRPGTQKVIEYSRVSLNTP